MQRGVLLPNVITWASNTCQEKERTRSDTGAMDGFYTSYIRWFRRDVISGKVGQYERDIEESDRYAGGRACYNTGDSWCTALVHK